MGKVISLVNQKGGVGKTTTTANVGSSLALRGKKVVLVDTDIGLRNLDVVMGLENRIVYDIVDVINNKVNTFGFTGKDNARGVFMKLMDKLKNALFEEEYVEVEEKPKQKPKREKGKPKK